VSVKDFEDLEVWKLARELTNQVYAVSGQGNFAKDYVLRDQIRRSAVSVISNIAEGFERGGNSEFIQFLCISKGSCGEVRCQLHIALDQHYVDKENGDLLINSFRKLSVMINNFIVYLKSSKYKGLRYKKLGDEQG
jgi:four helix bundle protein